MRKKKLLENPTRLTMGEIDGSLFEADGVKVLETDFFSMSGELVRHFNWEGHYLTYFAGEWSNTMLWTQELGTHAHNETERYAKAKMKFLKGTGTYSVTGFEEDIASGKRYRAKMSKYQRTNRRVRELTPELPPGALAYIRSFIDKEKWCFKEKDRKIIWTCGECKETFRRKLRCGEIISCPRCGERVKATRAKAKGARTKVVILQEDNEGRILERQFMAESRITPKTTEESVTEEVRGFGDEIGCRWNEWYYGEYLDRYGEDQSWTWSKGMGSGINCLAKGYIFTGNLKELGVPDNVIRTIEYEQKKGRKQGGSGFIQWLQKHPQVEYILRCNYPRLIKDYDKGLAIAAIEEKTVWDMFGMTKKQFKDLKAIDANHVARKAYVMYGASFREAAALNKMPAGAGERILRISQVYGLPIAHLVTLIGGLPQSEVYRYDDYLRMAQERGEDISDEIIYRNKRWSEFHDRYVEEKEKEQARERIKEVNRKYKAIRRDFRANRELFGWSSGAFEVIVPKAAGEIITEGRLQHHCVGTGDCYIEKMNRRETFIVFLRKKEDLKTPYYTIETEPDGKIRQAYAAYDRKPDWETVEKILKVWTKEVKKRSEKIRAQEAV